MVLPNSLLLLGRVSIRETLVILSAKQQQAVAEVDEPVLIQRTFIATGRVDRPAASAMLVSGIGVQRIGY